MIVMVIAMMMMRIKILMAIRCSDNNVMVRKIIMTMMMRSMVKAILVILGI